MTRSSLRRHTGAGATDVGFTMVETAVAIVVVLVVAASLTGLFVTTTRITHLHGDRQLAIQLADDAMERVHALKVAALLTGRDENSARKQWNNPLGAVGGMLASGHTDLAYDADAGTGDGISAVLPTAPLEVTLNGLTYRQHFYIGTCVRPTADTAECVSAASAASAGKTDVIPFYRVIVAVTWSGLLCANGECAYVSSSLIGSKTEEPVFNTNTGVDTLDVTTAMEATRYNDVTLPVTLAFEADGGEGDLTWRADNLPPGMSINASTGTVSGTPTTAAAGTWATRVTVSDVYEQEDYVAWTWYIRALPVISTASTATFSAPGGAAYTRTFAATGGSPALVWTAVNLPPGLTMAAGTGVVSGTPTTLGTYSATITVTDAHQQAASKTFTFSVPALSMSVAGQTLTIGTAASITIAAAGGFKPYLYTAVNLPAGLTMDGTTGIVSGTPTSASTWTVTIRVTDSAGATVSRNATWRVT
jgi:type II secretory pathway pseudopilin PulG